MKDYQINKISYEDTKPFILNIHYAKRMPSITYSFGLFYKTGFGCAIEPSLHKCFDANPNPDPNPNTSPNPDPNPND